MPKKRKRKPPKKPKRQSKFVSRPAAPQSPSFDKLRKTLRQMTPHIQAAGFNNFVLVGYRRVPENERHKFGGAEEIPFYFYNFPGLEPAGALMDWAAEDVKNRIVEQALKGPPPEKKKEEKDE